MRRRSGLGLTAAYQLHEFLRSRSVAAVALLLRHGATNPGPLRFRLTWFAGRGFLANIDVAIAHDDYPLLKVRHNAQRCEKLHGV